MERKKNNFGKRMVAYLLAVLMCISIVPVSASALSKIDIGRDVSLKVIYKDGSRELSDVSFSLYRVAEVTENAKCRLTGDFKKYEDTVSLKNLDAAGWKNTALTLKGYVQRDNLSATRIAKTDATGAFVLSNLETGLYLMLGDRTVIGDYIYTTEPVLLFLPGRDAVSGEWNYDVSVHVKYDRDHSGGGGGGKEDDEKSYKVLKVWKDEGHKKERPNKITVQLLRDGKVYDKVDLTEKNNWRYTWKNLSDKYEWMVVEKEEDNYTVSVSKEGTTFVMTNTYDEEEPSPPGENPPGENPPGEEPPDEEEEIVLGDIDEIIPKTEKVLPKTGALWWPVPVLACGGLILIMAGCFIKRRQMNEEE